jgi:6,7-dimethyl-8-ribityllumazine synthase
MNIRIENLQIAPEWRVGVVTSRFNDEITSKLEEGALARLRELGAKDEQIMRLSVPGAVEIPLAAQALLKKGCAGVIALGAVIRGETAHFDYVCRSVERGCSDVALEFGRPVAFGVLTVDNDEQALDRVGGRHGHKGVEAAEVVAEMIQLLKELQL